MENYNPRDKTLLALDGYSDLGIALRGVFAYGWASVAWNLITTGNFNPKKQSNTATAIGVVAALATVSSRVLIAKRHGSPGMFGIGSAPNIF